MQNLHYSSALYLIYTTNTGIGRSVAAALLSNGASVVISSSTQSKVDAAVELLTKGVESGSNVTVSGHSFDIKDFTALTGFLTQEAPFDHLVSEPTSVAWYK